VKQEEPIDPYVHALEQLEAAKAKVLDLQRNATPFAAVVVVVYEPTRGGVLGQERQWGFTTCDDGLPETHRRAVYARRQEALIELARKLDP